MAPDSMVTFRQVYVYALILQTGSYNRSAAAELGAYGITVNVVSPGPVQSGYITPKAEKAFIKDIPVGRIGRPEDIANAVVFFASKQADWITGQLLFVHGGHRMAFGQ